LFDLIVPDCPKQKGEHTLNIAKKIRDCRALLAMGKWTIAS
jgi:hypothetical protein